MSFQGMIEDVPVADIMQLVHLGGHSGTLSIHSGSDSGHIGFERGRIVSAWYPGSMRLGEILVKAGRLDGAALVKALEIQNQEMPRRSIGQILVRMGATTPEAIREAMAHEIERVVGAILAWKTGRFEFVLDDLTPLVEVTRFTGTPRVNLDTQQVLMEALQRVDVGTEDEPQADPVPDALMDELGTPELVSSSIELAPGEKSEMHTRRTSPSLQSVDAVPAEAEEPEVERPRYQLVSGDAELLERINALLAESGEQAFQVSLRDAGSSLLGEAPPIVVVDLRHQIHTLSTLSALCRSRPRASVIVLFEGRCPLRELYRSGVLSVTSPVPETVVACMRTVARQRRYMANETAIADGVRTSLAKLRRIIADLRSGLLGTSVSTNLLSALAESLDRGVLFVPHRERLVALGAFGHGVDGVPLSESTRGMILPLADSGAFAACVADMHTRRIGYVAANFAPEFRKVVDCPRNNEVAILPVPGSEKLIALIYLDNGAKPRPIGDIEIFELASFQLGLALENELLRRELRAKGILPTPPAKTGPA